MVSSSSLPSTVQAERIVPRAAPCRAGLASWAAQDWFAVTFLATLMSCAAFGTAGPERTRSLWGLAAYLVAVVAGITWVRSGRYRGTCWSAVYYRCTVVGSVQLSYFLMRDLLPAVNSGSLDVPLLALDRSLFGVEPALALDVWVGPLSSEWFAFFYFAYFLLLALTILPVLLLSRHQQLLGELGLGVMLLYGVGHVLYMLVPGFGPIVAMQGEFHNAFPSGQWIDSVFGAVATGGAHKDIFPSLHTAAPLFLAMYCFRHRQLLPFRYVWAPLYLFALNILVATMFLRWHYALDVVAGLVLAGVALSLSVAVTRGQATRRVSLGLPPAWPISGQPPRESRPLPTSHAS